MTIGLAVGAGLAMALVMALAWAAQWRWRNAGWVDVFWSFGTGLVGAACAWAQPGGWRAWLVGALALAWGARLGFYLARRTLGSPREDVRYARFRAEWGAAFQPRMFWFLMIQAVVGALLALCVAVAARAPAALRPLDMAAGLVFAAGVIGESLSDRQMHRFRANPANRGRVCDTGLWGWSRHPNYFFECLTWCAYPLFAIAPGYGWGYAAILGPAAMVLLLTKASGIPPLEREMLESRGPAFAAYQARVSAFIPLPPKSTRETDMKTGPTP